MTSRLLAVPSGPWPGTTSLGESRDVFMSPLWVAWIARTQPRVLTDEEQFSHEGNPVLRQEKSHGACAVPVRVGHQLG